MGILRQREGNARPRRFQVSGALCRGARVRFLGQVDIGMDTWTHGHSRDSQPCQQARCLSRWPFKTASPTVLLTALEVLEGVGNINRYSPSSTSCDGEVSLELGPASPCPCGLRLSSQLRGGLFPCADRMGLCRVCIRPVILCSSFSTITSTLGGGVKVSSSAYRYREPLPASRCRFRLHLPPAPVASRSAAVDNPHFIPQTRPRPRPLFCDLRHLVHTCAYPH